MSAGPSPWLNAPHMERALDELWQFLHPNASRWSYPSEVTNHATAELRDLRRRALAFRDAEAALSYLREKIERQREALLKVQELADGCEQIGPDRQWAIPWSRYAIEVFAEAARALAPESKPDTEGERT